MAGPVAIDSPGRLVSTNSEVVTVAHKGSLFVDTDEHRVHRSSLQHRLGEAGQPVLESIEMWENDNMRDDGEALAAVATRPGEVVRYPAEGAGPGRTARESSPRVPCVEDCLPYRSAGKAMGEITRIAARQVDKASAGHLCRQIRAFGILTGEDLERYRLDTHVPVVRSAQLDPVTHAFGALLGGRRREEDGPLRSPGEQFGVDGDHDIEELAASHESHRPRTCEAAHLVGPDGVDIRFTLVVR